MWFVSLGIGYEDSIYIGILSFSGLSYPTFKTTAKSRTSMSAPSVVTLLEWRGDTNLLGESRSIRFQHEGRCCVCARPLTNPESIDAGVGPECAGKL